MRIHVKDGKDANIRLWIPSGFVLNGVTASLLPAVLEKQGIHITPKQASDLIKTLKDFRRRNPDWVLMEVMSADGEEVYIKL